MNDAIAIKLTEHAGEIGSGIGPETSPLFTLYLRPTGFHLLHVLGIDYQQVIKALVLLGAVCIVVMGGVGSP